MGAYYGLKKAVVYFTLVGSILGYSSPAESQVLHKDENGNVTEVGLEEIVGGRKINFLPPGVTELLDQDTKNKQRLINLLNFNTEKTKAILEGYTPESAQGNKKLPSFNGLYLHQEQEATPFIPPRRTITSFETAPAQSYTPSYPACLFAGGNCSPPGDTTVIDPNYPYTEYSYPPWYFNPALPGSILAPGASLLLHR